MKSQSSYVPPTYIPLGQSDEDLPLPAEEEDVEPTPPNPPQSQPVRWSSGICACCDDMQSCCIGLFFPCYLFGKNAEFLGSGTLVGSCITHFILWAFGNTLCCVLTPLPGFGCFISCYACGYRRTLRSKYNLEEAPCGDFATHFFCHLCAICQEYREIRERAGETKPPDLNLAVVTAPDVQTMESSGICTTFVLSYGMSGKEDMASVVIERDCEQAMRLLKAKDKDNQGLMLVRRIHQLAGKMQKIDYRFAPREVNSIADAMAKLC